MLWITVAVSYMAIPTNLLLMNWATSTSISHANCSTRLPVFQYYLSIGIPTVFILLATVSTICSAVLLAKHKIIVAPLLLSIAALAATLATFAATLLIVGLSDGFCLF